MTVSRLYLSVFFAFLLPCLSEAEFACRSEISFKVQSASQPVSATPDASKSQNGGKVEPPVPAPEREVFFTAIEEKGDSEENAREKVQRKVPQEKERAIKFCTSNYENVAGCLASKYASMDSVIATLDFKARAELQKAISSDCRAQSGKCLDAKASDPKCSELQAPKEAAAADAGKGKEAAAGSADKGKKGKK